MKRRHTIGLPILAGLIAFAAHVPAAAAQQVELRLKGSPGQTMTYAVELNQNLLLPDQYGGETNMNSAMTLNSRISDVKGDTIYMALSITDPSFEVTGTGGAQSPDLSMVEGKEFTQVVTSRGEAVDFVSPEGLGQAGASVASSLSQFGSLPLPDGPVSVGDSWTDTIRSDGVPMGLPVDGEMVTVSTITFQELSDEGGSKIAHLAIEAQIVFEPAPESDGQMDFEMISDVASNLRFDVTNGVLIANSTASEFEAIVSGAMVPEPITFYGTAETTITRQ